ncbi:LysM peptidoglycan-binding domain-containing protein [Corallococcus llansteffanensis]|uniref:LysM peptidoglycan-binding domain-containing protein n=1 Tax=Corallococcus llansteffanensis TaxID=2316731 RepID=A0A3A8Q5I8_9BACT|nr:LysM domain-containing protein [Corallococcus llansteffanensis]RKH63916.1 LysM peptidoglycan-binding domain-containing protein [Corallococcus llansteffanensis]
MPPYIVQPADTLNGIAAKKLGNANRWPEIARLNKLANPNLLLVGQRLELPGTQAVHPSFVLKPAPNPWAELATLPELWDRGPGERAFLATTQAQHAQEPATFAWARGSLFVVFSQLSETTGKLIRKVAVVPTDFSLLPANLLGKITPAEHAMALNPTGSQFLSTSQKVFGAPSINGTPLLIDIAKAEAAGARIIPIEQLVSELKQFAAQNPGAQTRVNKLIDIIQTVEGEVLIEGRVAGQAVSKLPAAHTAYVRAAEDLWKQFASKKITKAQLEAGLKKLETAFGKSRFIGRLGRALTVVGVVFTVKDVADATQRSIHQKSYKPLAAESIRQAGGWGGAFVGAKAGFAVGALFGIETGPGALITGALGAIIVGGAAYYGCDLLADQLSPN